MRQSARRAAIASAYGKCSRCLTTDRLEVHHRTYARAGHELPTDVEVLCYDCHHAEHGHWIPLSENEKPLDLARVDELESELAALTSGRPCRLTDARLVSGRGAVRGSTQLRHAPDLSGYGSTRIDGRTRET